MSGNCCPESEGTLLASPLDDRGEGGGFPVEDLRGFLQGRWIISRHFRDRRRTSWGTFEGEAQFRPSTEGLLYREQGRIQTTDFRGAAGRSYLFGFPEPHRALVSHADGRPFYGLDLREGFWQVSHECGDDLYSGDFGVRGPDLMVSRWNIEGPRKDAVITTIFRRRDGE